MTRRKNMYNRYKCWIWSNSSHVRLYNVSTRSALKAAQMYGRCEGGEIVQVRTRRSNKVLSEVRWTPEGGGKYYRVTIG